MWVTSAPSAWGGCLPCLRAAHKLLSELHCLLLQYIGHVGSFLLEKNADVVRAVSLAGSIPLLPLLRVQLGDVLALSPWEGLPLIVLEGCSVI